MFKNTLIALFSLLILTSCDIYDRKAMEQRREDTIAYLKSLGLESYNQYGTVYRIGNFGGVPIMADESFGGETKESADGVKYVKQAPETFETLISSLYTEFRYTDGAIYVGSHSIPKEISHQRDSEQQNDPDHTWISARFSNIALQHQPNNIYSINNKNADFILNAKKYYRHNDIYIYQGIEYGLEKYVLDEHSKNYYANIPHSSSPTDTKDVYFSRDQAGNYIDLIKCSNHHRPMARKCRLSFTHKANHYFTISFYFQRVHLKDWQKIKQMSIDRIESVMVKDKDILKRIEERHRVKP